MSHYVNKSNKTYNTGNNISDNKPLVHIIFDFNIIMLSAKKLMANNDPIKNVGILTVPENPGIKNPTTAEPKRIFAKSANVFAANSI